MKEIYFDHPEAFWLLWLVPLLIVGYVWYIQKRYASIKLSGYPFLLQKKQRGWLRHLPLFFELIALVGLIIVIARPQNRNSWESSSIEGIDLVLVLDTSTSMNAIDLSPNRFKAAQEVAAEMIANRPNDNIGLVAFAGESFTQCPTTTDHETLQRLLSELHTGMMEDGTAIGLGIATGINTLRNSKAKSKVMILLTDGSNNSGDITPTMGAQMAASLGIRVYTVAVGTRGIAKYPVSTTSGTRYVDQEVSIDEPTLRNIAQTTGGIYYRAVDNKELQKIYREIDHLEKSKLMTKNFKAYEELFPSVAVVALFLLLIAYILRTTLLRINP